MEIGRVSALDVRQIERGSLFYLGRRGSPPLCLKGFKKEPDGTESERIIPIQSKDDPRSERRAIYASSLNGIGLLIQDARIVPDLSSVTHTSTTGYGEASLYVCADSLYLPLQGGTFEEPVLDLSTGEVLDQLPQDKPWAGLTAWRIETGLDVANTIFERVASAEGE